MNKKPKKMNTDKQRQDTALAIARQELQKNALILAYVFGSAPGWYAVVQSTINGFSADYGVILGRAGDFEDLRVRAFYVLETDKHLEELDEIRAAVMVAQQMEGLPPVINFTEKAIARACSAVFSAMGLDTPDSPEGWLEKLCCDGSSSLGGTDWAAIRAALGAARVANANANAIAIASVPPECRGRLELELKKVDAFKLGLNMFDLPADEISDLSDESGYSSARSYMNDHDMYKKTLREVITSLVKGL